MSAEPLGVGRIVQMRGFFGKALFLRQQPAAELERRLGYRAGRLREGWWLLFAMKMPAPEGFEVAGYSQMSGGVVQGHLPRPADPRTAEARLRDDGHDLIGLKTRLVEQTFKLTGPERLAKVVPVADAHGTPGVPDYPPGSGIPQWKLTQGLPWRVAAFVEADGVYGGMYV